ncbi:MAG: helix-turn-helix transcriptional regulator [Veillonella sp.]|jgi:transcriptional regulator with XRE-family HTH domain|uniref:helix-turn-helix domain-containing protein n=1 Tax=Veillonella sp. TaxID=1926307 RepID=UPI001EC1F185|nr:helix-turn-helix transcriptional regulator [Veillonella sp.]MBS5764466.1 helix-turn-helix transcriptional regulator [Veillonella sp.]
MTEQIHERIKRLRKQNKLSVDEIVKKLNISRATYYRYESNEIEKLPLTILEPLAKILNTTPAYLMGWQEPHQGSTSTLSKQTEDYYLDAETAEYAEMLRTRPEMRMLFSASRGISKEEMQEAVNYIEFIKSRNKK